MLYIVIALTLGILAGTVTGLIPGLHINLLAAIIAGSAAALVGTFSPAAVGVFLLAMSITHTFVDAIPAVFLGVAEGSELLSLLPSQKMVLAGKGMLAISLLTAGALGCLVLSIAFMPVFVKFFPWFYRILKPYTWILLVGILVWMLVREKGANTTFWSFIVVLAAGILGLVVLRGLRLDDPLLPMLSGLFGTSALVHAFVARTQVPPQEKTSAFGMKKSSSALSLVAGTIGGSIIALLPGLGPAQAAVAAKTFFQNLTRETFLLMTGGINTVNMVLSLVTMSTLGFARNGSFEVMLGIVKRPDMHELFVFAAITLVVGGIATVITLKLARPIANLLGKVNYRIVSGTVLFIVGSLVAWRSGLLGIAVLLVATATGLVAILTGAPRHHLMACILIPVIWATV